MLTRRLILGLAITALTLGLGADARADSTDDALRKMGAARTKLKTLQGRFRQTRVIGLLAEEVKSKGSLLLVRPGRLRWRLEPPDSVTYWMGPEGFAMATAGGVSKVGKGAAGRFAAVLGDLMVLLGGDLTKLKARYHLRVSQPKGRFVLVAKPRPDKNPEVAKHIASLRLETGAKLWAVQRIVIEERKGDRSVIVFDKLERDKPIKPALMKPPAKR